MRLNTRTCAYAAVRGSTRQRASSPSSNVSPKRRQDDGVDMTAMRGEALDYTVEIPRDPPPGLYWSHTHPHGESYRQVLDGMSGPLIIEGIERYAPAVRQMRERVLVIRAMD